MAKFGLFQGSGLAPIQEIDGDYMVQKGDHVAVYVRAQDSSQVNRQVGAFKLEKGQCVKEIK